MPQVTRVSIWEAPDSDLHHPEPANVVFGDDVATLKIADRNWPTDLEPDDIQPGWQVMAHGTKKSGDGMELVYEGEIVEAKWAGSMAGTMYKLECEPATKPSQNFIPPTAHPNPQLPQP